VLDGEYLYKGERILVKRRLPASTSYDRFLYEKLTVSNLISFSITVNKAREQSFKEIGCNLPSSVSAYGQLNEPFLGVRKFWDSKIEIGSAKIWGKIKS
jgi:hypothetical protein